MTKKGKLLAFVNYNGLPLMTLGDKCLLSEIKPWGLGAVKGRHKDPLSEGGWQRALSGLNQHFLESPKPMSLCIDIKTGSFFFLGFPGHSVGKESTCNAGDTDSIPGSGGPPGERHGNPFQYLAWKIPWTKETGRLQSMELQRVRYNWVPKHPGLGFCF